jgi:hypothetical protein
MAIEIHETNFNNPNREANGVVMTVHYGDSQKAAISISGIPRMSPGEFLGELKSLAATIQSAVHNPVSEIIAEPVEQSGRLIYPGPAPFYLERTQNASAKYAESGVEITVNSIVDGHGPLPVSTRFQLSVRAADELATGLLRAIADADFQGRNPQH